MLEGSNSSFRNAVGLVMVGRAKLQLNVAIPALLSEVLRRVLRPIVCNDLIRQAILEQHSCELVRYGVGSDVV